MTLQNIAKACHTSTTCSASQLIAACNTYIWSAVHPLGSMFLRDAIVERKMLTLCLLHRLGILLFVTQLRMETMLIGYILYGAQLIPWIHIGEGATYHTRAIGDLGMLAIHMTWRTTSLIAEDIWIGWPWLWCCCGVAALM